MPPHIPEPAEACPGPSYHSGDPKEEGQVEGVVVVGSHSPVAPAELEAARVELERLKELPGMREPQRAFMHDQAYLWRFGAPPDYTLANLHYLKGKTMTHAEGSLEQVVEDLVKTWEFERSHKLSHVQHKSVDQQHFRIGANSGKRYDNVEANKVGNYNVLLDGVDPALWPQDLSWDKTHHLFKEAFPAAFPWEVLKVFSGPPKVAFSWRHWAHFTGAYQGNQGKGELVEMFGFATATVSADLKLQEVEVYYNPEEFLKVLEGKLPASALSKGASLMGPGCPALSRATGGGCPFMASKEDNTPDSGNKGSPHEQGHRGGPKCTIL